MPRGASQAFIRYDFSSTLGNASTSNSDVGVKFCSDFENLLLFLA